MAKDNIRSFRFSSEVAAILEGQEGKSLNDKFETLVLFCYYKVEERKEELARVEKRISEKQNELYDLSRKTEQLHMLKDDLDKMDYYLKMAGKRAKNFADRTIT